MTRVMIRTLLQRGTTCLVGVPKVLMKELGWAGGDKLALTIKDGELVVNKVDASNGSLGRVVGIKHGVIEIEQEDN